MGIFRYFYPVIREERAYHVAADEVGSVGTLLVIVTGVVDQLLLATLQG